MNCACYAYRLDKLDSELKLSGRSPVIELKERSLQKTNQNLRIKKAKMKWKNRVWETITYVFKLKIGNILKEMTAIYIEQVWNM